MSFHIRVLRYQPEKDSKQYYQTFELDVNPTTTILEALYKIKDDIDGTLTFRSSCRSSICGSCAMHVNGDAKLACKTSLAREANDAGEIVIEPMTNFPPMKDLVVDMGRFWEKIGKVRPWLTPPAGEPPKGEYLVPKTKMDEIKDAENCIMCGCCVSDCTVFTVDKNFFGPAALAKALRFVADARDSTTHDRLESLTQYGGMWDCTHCMECVQQCPKGVKPMDQIITLRQRSMAQGINQPIGARHAHAFAKFVKNSGVLDETRLTPASVGYFNLKQLLPLMPAALALRSHGKAPIIHHKIPNYQNFKKVVDAVESKS